MQRMSPINSPYLDVVPSAAASPLYSRYATQPQLCAVVLGADGTVLADGGALLCSNSVIASLEPLPSTPIPEAVLVRLEANRFGEPDAALDDDDDL